MQAPAASILIVEDDPGLLNLLGEYLSAAGFETHLEDDGARALGRIRELDPDVVVLDLMLPGLGGLEICRRAREGFEGGILMLTARRTDADQMLGLELGADDYVVKPIEPRLLVARLRALLRRLSPTSRSERDLEVGGLRASRSRREATLDGTALDLTGAEFDVLCLLMRAAGEVVSREELHREVRGVAYNGADRSIDINVSRLRRKLREAGLDDCLKSIRGVGYFLVRP